VKAALLAAALAAVLPACSPAASTVAPVVVVTAKPEAPRSVPAVTIPGRFYRAVVREAYAAGVPLWLAGRLIAAESGWDPDAVGYNDNGTQDLGLAQLNSRYLDYFARYNDWQQVDPFDPDMAIRVACRYLEALYRATGTWEGAVAAYNCGLGRYRTGSIPQRTREHVERIFNLSSQP
jgi:soluble lytic murein transglycosylase-like protein